MYTVGGRQSAVVSRSHQSQSSVGSVIRQYASMPQPALQRTLNPIAKNRSIARTSTLDARLSTATVDCDCRPTTPDCRLSIQHPFEEPRPRLPLLEQPADRAVAECDVPLVAIPTASCVGPPGARRSPRAGASVDPAAGHAAAVDGQPHGTAAFDRHAHRNGRPEPPEHRRKRPDRRTRGRPARRRRAPPERSGARGPASDGDSGVRGTKSPGLGRTRASRSHPADACRAVPADPHRVSPTSAPSRAVSVATVSAEGSARSSSEYWITRPGAGSISIVTMSTAAAGGCDSRSSIRSVRSTRASRMRRRQLQTRARASVRSTSRRSSRSAAAPRSARSSEADSGSSSRASTNDSGSSVSIGHSSSIRSTKRGTSGSGTSGPGSQPQRELLKPHARPAPCAPTARRRSSAASSPMVVNPQRRAMSNARSYRWRAASLPGAPSPARQAASRPVPLLRRRSCCRVHRAEQAATNADTQVRRRPRPSTRSAPASAAWPQSWWAQPPPAIGRIVRCRGSRELFANRRRIAEQTAEPRHIADDAGGALALRAEARSRARRRRSRSWRDGARRQAKRGGISVQGSRVLGVPGF